MQRRWKKWSRGASRDRRRRWFPRWLCAYRHSRNKGMVGGLFVVHIAGISRERRNAAPILACRHAGLPAAGDRPPPCGGCLRSGSGRSRSGASGSCGRARGRHGRRLDGRLNGAAAWQLRKAIGHTPLAVCLALLQWGRNLAVAEGARPYRAARWSRCFNGAATWQLRKAPWSKRMPCGAPRLQWGRNLAAANGVDSGDRHVALKQLQWGRNLAAAEGTGP